MTRDELREMQERWRGMDADELAEEAIQAFQHCDQDPCVCQDHIRDMFAALASEGVAEREADAWTEQSEIDAMRAGDQPWFRAWGFKGSIPVWHGTPPSHPAPEREALVLIAQWVNGLPFDWKAARELVARHKAHPAPEPERDCVASGCSERAVPGTLPSMCEEHAEPASREAERRYTELEIEHGLPERDRKRRLAEEGFHDDGPEQDYE